GFEPNQLLRLEPSEAHVAGRLGLCNAVEELLAAGVARVQDRLAALGRLTRASVDGIGGWRVVEPYDEPTAATTLVPSPGVHVAETQSRLHHAPGILTSRIEPARAPREMTGPVLRVSPHLGTTAEDIQALAEALPG